jgi:hypothetical protein
MNSSKNKLENISLIEEILPIQIEMYFSKSSRSIAFWNRLISISKCFVFGGFIVDLLKSESIHRDIDIVVDTFNDESFELVNQYNGIRNSFGGFKLNIDGIHVDLWAIKDTWVIKKMNYLDFDLFSILPSTSFFNSTAIIFSIQEKQLIYNNKFLDFINQNNLDILFEDNPYPELCIIKSFQNYCDGVSLSNNLKKYIVRKFVKVYEKLNSIQIRHYGDVKYTEEDLMSFYLSIIKELNNNKKSTNVKTYSDQLVLF